MKKIITIFTMLLLLMACEAKSTARSAVAVFLGEYQNLSERVLADVEDVVRDETLNEEQKEKYKDILKRQYQDMVFAIGDEAYDGDKATVDVQITVYDLYKAENEANIYLTNNYNEFVHDGVFDNSAFNDYKLDLMANTTDTVIYTITFNLEKDDDGTYHLVDVTRADLEKIHGIYNYEEN